MDENRLRERKAARGRAIVAGAASIAIHALFFALLFAFAPIPPRALPTLEVRVQGGAPDARGGARPTAAARSGDGGSAKADRPPLPTAVPAAATAPSAVPGQAAAPSAADPASTGEARVPVPPAPSYPARGSGALGDTTGTGNSGDGARLSASAQAGSSGPEGRRAGGAAGGGSIAGGSPTAEDPVGALAARIVAAVEARKVYPEAARRRGTEGAVLLRLSIAEDGSLLAAKLAETSGSALLDRSALDLAASIFPVDNSVGRRVDIPILVRYSLKR